MEIGGGFGGKTVIYLEPIAAMLSKLSGVPVKVTMSRAEVLEATGPTSGCYMKVRIGADDEGKIHAQLIKLVEKSEERGAAVGIGHVKPKTLKILKKHIPELQKKGYKFEFVSKMLH